jgi:hypothetical protein
VGVWRVRPYRLLAAEQLDVELKWIDDFSDGKPDGIDVSYGELADQI